MQQTKRYKLNQIEPQDHFLPQALAENAQKIEDALLAHEEQVDGQLSALDQRVAVFEAVKFTCGTYIGRYKYDNQDPVTVQIGFTPKILFISKAGLASYTALAFQSYNTYGDKLSIVPGGFRVLGSELSAGEYHYIAFA